LAFDKYYLVIGFLLIYVWTKIIETIDHEYL